MRSTHSCLALYIITSFASLLCCYACGDAEKENRAILLADREAPLGWVHLKMYQDRSFEFISSGLRMKDVYPGKFRISNDTIFFTYKDSIPGAGTTAIISDKSVNYIDGQYPESVEIKLNKLSK